MVAGRQDGGQEQGNWGENCNHGLRGKFAVEKGRSLGRIGGQLKSEKVKDKNR